MVFEVFMGVKIYVAIVQVEDGRPHIASDDMYGHPRKDKKNEWCGGGTSQC
jgi:hypothetical protein